LNPARDEALVFDCAGTPLLGVLSRPAARPAAAVGVVVVVGGPQYRAGSHRQFVMLARHLAAAGFPVLRFDARGMGDSAGAQRSFEELGDDVRAAVSALMEAEPGLRGVVLWGLCDGASAALLALHERADPRVLGLALLNPWVRSVASLARTHVKHYYRQRLMERAFWAKLLRGGVALQALRDLLGNLRAAFGGGGRRRRAVAEALPFQQRMARAWATFDGGILLLLSERDHTAQEFIEFSQGDAAWQAALRARVPQRVTLAGADHTCSDPAAQAAAEAATLQWLRDQFGATDAAAGNPPPAGAALRRTVQAA
jgi:exosortase A-associated hydrolase 1